MELTPAFADMLEQAGIATAEQADTLRRLLQEAHDEAWAPMLEAGEANRQAWEERQRTG